MRMSVDEPVTKGNVQKEIKKMTALRFELVVIQYDIQWPELYLKNRALV